MDRQNSDINKNELEMDSETIEETEQISQAETPDKPEVEVSMDPDTTEEEDQATEDQGSNDKPVKKSKKREPIPFRYIFRYFVTALAAANLVLLFVFNYDVPGFSYVITKLENYRDHVEGVDGTVAEADNTVIFEYDKESYNYEGKGEFDPTVDVTVKTLDGQELSKDYLSSSVTGESSKQIVYSYRSEDGQYYGTTKRELKLDNYNAPVIILTGTAPVLDDGNLAKIGELCTGIYTATDGYGKDITDSVTVTAVPDTQYNGEFIVQFSVTNQFGDTAKNELRTTTQFQKPHLKLTMKEATITRGEPFDPLSYIMYAIDADGSNLTDLVDVEGDVDTYKVGDYKVNYDLTSPGGQSVKTKKLTVHVVE